MFNIDVTIERIENGFLVTGNDGSKSKRYFPSLEKFVESEMLEAAKEEDKFYREHDSSGTLFSLRAETSSPQNTDDTE